MKSITWVEFWDRVLGTKTIARPTQDEAIIIAKKCLEEILVEFPDLAIKDDPQPGPVEWSITIPRQPGLEFEIGLNLQNGDELHINGPRNFWASYFPCNDPKIAAVYVDHVKGLINGKYRIGDGYLGVIPLGSTLQKYVGYRWKVLSGAFGASLVPWFLKFNLVTRNNRNSANTSHTH